MIRLRTPLLAAALAAGVGVAGLAPAFAQSAAAPQTSAAAPAKAYHHASDRMMPGQLADGRIAFLKAELKITPSQEAQWRQVAAAMRDNASALDKAITAARQNRGEMNAVERIEQRQHFASMRADNDARLLAAFKPLYASLTPEQQQTANQLVAAHHGWHHRA